MEKPPRVDLDWHRDWCERHLRPFRVDWPRGAMVAMALLFQAFTADPDVQKFCGRADAKGELADTKRIPHALAELGPACCKVGAPAMALIYQVALKRQPVLGEEV